MGKISLIKIQTPQEVKKIYYYFQDNIHLTLIENLHPFSLHLPSAMVSRIASDDIPHRCFGNFEKI